MKKRLLKWTAASALATAALGATAHAQSADAIIDKLVDKGILSVKEANELREESDKGFTQSYQVKSGMPDWVTSFKLNGDFRGRFEAFSAADNASPSAGTPGFTDRYRWRYRLRFGAVATIQNDLEVGFRLTSSERSDNFGGDPISGNTTMTDNASKKFIFVDQAYAKWSPLHTPDWSGSLIFGKMENPFVFSDMVFDGDYTPEGGAIQLGYNISDAHSLKLTGGAFILDEVGGSSSDPWMAGAQIRWDAKWSPKLVSTAGIAALGIAETQQLGDAAVPNVNRGNTRNGALLASDYNPIVADAALTYNLDSFPMYPGAFPIKVAADYMNNPAAEDNNYGYSVGVQLGKSGKKKTWDVGYTWKYLQSNAWYEELVDSDFGTYYPVAQPGVGVTAPGYFAGTNVKGHIVKVAYSPYDSLTLSAKWFRTELIDAAPSSVDSTMNRIQVDASLKF